MLHKLQGEFGVPTMPEMRIRVQVQDASGKMVIDREEQAHSFTRNGWNWYVQVLTEGLSNVAGSATSPVGGNWREGNLVWRQLNSPTLITGSTSSITTARSTGLAAQGFQGALGATTPGIVVGTSAEPWSPEDYSLWGPVNHGTATGQLTHNAMTTPAPVYDSGTKKYTTTLVRVFNNNSGGSITLNECGLVFLAIAGQTFLMTRDVLAAPVNVANGAQVTISIALISQAFTSLESSAIVPANPGTSLGGGVSLGNYLNWASSTLYGTIGGHAKYVMVLSPKTGGDSAAVAFRTTSTAITYTGDLWNGNPGTDAIVALGASSALGQFVSAQRSAVLGGYADWYLPSNQEFANYILRIADVAGGEQMNAANYWVADSFGSGSTSGVVFNGSTGAGTGSILMTATARARLIRRHKWA
jgi:hypothetical protein